MTSRSPLQAKVLRDMQNLDKLQKAAGKSLIMGFVYKAFNKYVAGKVNFTYMRGTDGMQ
jgi:hypothetical protein